MMVDISRILMMGDVSRVLKENSRVADLFRSADVLFADGEFCDALVKLCMVVEGAINVLMVGYGLGIFPDFMEMGMFREEFVDEPIDCDSECFEVYFKTKKFLGLKSVITDESCGAVECGEEECRERFGEFSALIEDMLVSVSTIVDDWVEELRGSEDEVDLLPFCEEDVFVKNHPDLKDEYFCAAEEYVFSARADAHYKAIRGTLSGIFYANINMILAIMADKKGLSGEYRALQFEQSAEILEEFFKDYNKVESGLILDSSCEKNLRRLCDVLVYVRNDWDYLPTVEEYENLYGGAKCVYNELSGFYFNNFDGSLVDPYLRKQRFGSWEGFGCDGTEFVISGYETEN